MTRFINSQTTIVTDAMDGALTAYAGAHLARLDGYPHTKVAIRLDADPNRVAVISGGGSGHEPAHIGFVGRGMLTAAVAGEVFASPSVDAVLAGILAVTGPAGCLLIVKNYTGDRLNFGLAAERAKQMGLNVEMVIVADDAALAHASQPRGIAGTLFVHKVAGHHAERGADLAAVKAAAAATAGAVRSIGLSLATCDLPGQPRRSAHSTPELGLGIHGEPGATEVDVEGARHAVDLLVERLTDVLPANADRLAVLVNNLGSVTPLEMGILTRDLLESDLASRIELMVGPGAFMTSLNMYGFSLSALPLDDARAEAICAPVGPVAWMPAMTPAVPAVREVPIPAAQDGFPSEAHSGNEQLLRAVCGALVDAEDSLNALDAKV
ncbi:MAG TPA: dihydroxyacetone kinase subunit DhaK, partial [Gammaproteobacteria bacterium]|nr:dihydroxyacetone kinase subunit DhaK [Gammaproteobacteria bacterium]